MALVEVRDHVVWFKHIHNDPETVSRLSRLSAGQCAELIVDGARGWWRRMADQPSGAATPGLAPLSQAKPFWQKLYAERRGDLVPLEVVEIPRPACEAMNWEPLPPYADATPEQRAEAGRRLLSVAGLGWRSDEPYGPRDELYDR
jgi:hypothetical protein